MRSGPEQDDERGDCRPARKAHQYSPDVHLLASAQQGLLKQAARTVPEPVGIGAASRP